MLNIFKKNLNIYVLLVIVVIIIYLYFFNNFILETLNVSESCKLETNKTRRRIREANIELENARYKMESAFRSCNRML